jgi:hypothetical protein
MIKQVSKTAKAEIEREFKKLYLKHVRKDVYEKAKKLTGTKVKVGNKNVLISNRGLKKAINQYAEDYLLKNFLIPRIKELLKEAKETKPPQKPKPNNTIVKWTRFYEVERLKIEFIIWEYHDGSMVFHSMKLKK